MRGVPARRVCVLGLGTTGFAAADSLLARGFEVVALSGRVDEREGERAALLRALGADVRLGPGADAQLPPGTDLVVTSPGVPPEQQAVLRRQLGRPIANRVSPVELPTDTEVVI